MKPLRPIHHALLEHMQERNGPVSAQTLWSERGHELFRSYDAMLGALLSLKFRGLVHKVRRGQRSLWQANGGNT